MKRTVRLMTFAAIVFASAGLVLAADEGLKRARELFERQEYLAAQEALLKVNRESLTEAEKKEFDQLAAILPEAIQGSERARQDQAEADRAYAEARWDEADRLYQQVAANPYSSEAQRGHARSQRQRIVEKKQLGEAARPSGPVTPAPPAAQPLAQETPQPAAQPTEPAGPSRLTLVEELRRRDDLLWQRAVRQAQEAARLARQALAEQRWDEARQLAEQAIQVIEAARAYAEPVSKYEAERQAAGALREEVRAAIDRAAIERAAQQQKEVLDQVRARKEAQERLRREKVEQLFNAADQLRRERKFSEAAEAIRQAHLIDPANPRAGYLLDVYEDLASLQNQGELNQALGRQARGALEEAREALVPWHANILYPRNWPEITARRRGIGRGFGTGAEEGELNRLLDKEKGLSEFNFQDTPLEQVLEFMADCMRVNMAVDWEDLNNHGIRRDKPISIRLKDITFRTGLRELLSQAGGDVPLAYTVGDGLIRVATKEKLDRDKFILVYDIRDLLVRVPRFAGPRLDLSQQSAGSGTFAGGSTQNLFADEGSETVRSGTHEGENNQLVRQIMEIIQTTVEPGSWSETGSGTGTLRELNGQLIVYNTSDAHRQVSDLLSQLRETRALMIAVEGRFLIVTSNFLEEIGVDLDFVFNAGTAGFDPAFNTQGAALRDAFTGASLLIPRDFSRIGALAAPPGVGTGLTQVTPPLQPYNNAALVPAPGGVIPQFNDMTPIGLQQGSLGMVSPSQLNTNVPGSFATSGLGPALNIAGSYLDNLQIDFLVRATQANRRSAIVQAPRLMMFNGQQAFVAITRDRQYVSSLQPVVAEGAVGVTPIPAFATSGTTLTVDGTISADRRYVTLTVDTALAEEPLFERFTIQRESGNSPGLFILLPDQQRRLIRTTVSVPDGGTVLLGGLKQSGEAEIEAGVPILSKIPILKRAFTNATTVKDSQTLLILLKAKILIQKEAEEDVFPGLVTEGS